MSRVVRCMAHDVVECNGCFERRALFYVVQAAADTNRATASPDVVHAVAWTPGVGGVNQECECGHPYQRHFIARLEPALVVLGCNTDGCECERFAPRRRAGLRSPISRLASTCECRDGLGPSGRRRDPRCPIHGPSVCDTVVEENDRQRRVVQDATAMLMNALAGPVTSLPLGHGIVTCLHEAWEEKDGGRVCSDCHEALPVLTKTDNTDSQNK